MTDQSAQEPTMEEILASIRRIISEDEAPAETAPAAATAEPEPESEAQAEPVSSSSEPESEPVAVEEEVLELTDRYEPTPTESIGDLDVVDPVAEPFPSAPHPTVAEEAFETASAPEPEPAAAPAYDSLVGESAAASAASAFAGLAASFKKPDAAPAAPSGPDLNFISGNSVEAMVAEMLRPMLKDWLDANLPAIVEAQVRKEVERIARNVG